MSELEPGDVLSYSAGSTQTGPEGFRKVRARASSPVAEIARRWPALLQALAGGRPPLFINAYPATIGHFDTGIVVDTYLSPRVLSRALQLGATRGHPVVLIGQPLWLAEALLRHLDAERRMPAELLLFVGGYALPRSLQRMLEARLDPAVSGSVGVVQFFGAAEVDAGCMMGRERTDTGEVIYHPRRDVEPALDGDALLLTLRNADGTAIIERFRTGDRARRHGDGWLIDHPGRLHPAVLAELEAWTDDDWRRRTGYLRREPDGIWIQLREGHDPRDDHELTTFEFAARFGFSWLDKPYWR